MSGIPRDVYVRLRETLLESGAFDSDDHLSAIFVTSPLAPWRKRLPQANNPTSRVDAVVNFLMNKRQAQTLTSALVLLVETLKDLTDPNDDLYVRLELLNKELRFILQNEHLLSPTPIQTDTSRVDSRDARIVSSNHRNKAFISYSHKDSRYLQELHTHLEHYVRKENLEVWDDTKILPGARWRDEIGAALQSACVAVLLVSADFLASDFIVNNELSSLLKAAEQEGVIILCVILRPCPFADTKLAEFQSVNAPSNPLAALTKAKREEVWVRVAQLVSRALKS